MFKSYWFLLVICLCFLFVAEVRSQSEGLVGYWNFNDCVAADSSGFGHKSTVVGDPECVDGIIGNAFEFDGDDYIRVSDSDQLDTDSCMTISLWIQPDSFASSGSKFMGKWYSAPQQGDWLFNTSSRDSAGKYLAWSVWLANYGVYGRVDGITTIGCNDTSNFLKLHKWNHIAVTFDTGYVKSYYNGLKIKQDTSILKYTSLGEYDTDDIYIGRYWMNRAEYAFFGMLDEIRIYNRALDEEEINNLYQQFTGIDESRDNVQAPEKFYLGQNYPNPFNPITAISYKLSAVSQVELSIYNLLGQKVAILVSEKQPVGPYKVEWDARNFSSGVYFYRLYAGEYQLTRKMILLR